MRKPDGRGARGRDDRASAPRAPEGVEMPPIPKAVSEELSLVSMRALDAQWFAGRALAALEAGRHSEAFELAGQAKLVANRSPTVREIRGVAAYLAGSFREALAELQAFRRMTESDAQDPRIADCYRGLGRPLRAVEFLDEKGTRGRAATLVRAGALADAGDVSGAAAALRLTGFEGATVPPAGFLPAGTIGSAARSRGTKRQTP